MKSIADYSDNILINFENQDWNFTVCLVNTNVYSYQLVQKIFAVIRCNFSNWFCSLELNFQISGFKIISVPEWISEWLCFITAISDYGYSPVELKQTPVLQESEDIRFFFFLWLSLCTLT